VRFADDQGMIADGDIGLQKIMDGLYTTALKYDYKDKHQKYKSDDKIQN
jgi:hypothetical protein